MLIEASNLDIHNIETQTHVRSVDMLGIITPSELIRSLLSNYDEVSANTVSSQISPVPSRTPAPTATRIGTPTPDVAATSTAILGKAYAEATMITQNADATATADVISIKQKIEEERLRSNVHETAVAREDEKKQLWADATATIQANVIATAVQRKLNTPTPNAAQIMETQTAISRATLIPESTLTSGNSMQRRAEDGVTGAGAIMRTLEAFLFIGVGRPVLRAISGNSRIGYWGWKANLAAPVIIGIGSQIIK